MRARWLLLLAAALAAGCEGDTLEVVERIPLSSDSSVSLHIDSTGIWLGAPGTLQRVGAGAEAVLQLPRTGEAAARPLGRIAERLYIRSGSALGMIGPDATLIGDTLREFEIDALALDPLGRFILRSSESGAVTGHAPASLLPMWGWAAVGTTSAALAISPEGDRVYQAREAGYDAGSASELLVRDLQTGRVLNRVELDIPALYLFTASGDRVIGAGWEEEGSESTAGRVFALRWSEGALGEAWARSLEDLDLTAPVRVELSPSGRLLAVASPENEAGLHLLEVETGATVGRLHGPVLDIGFDPNDRLYLLLPGELRRVE